MYKLVIGLIIVLVLWCIIHVPLRRSEHLTVNTTRLVTLHVTSWCVRCRIWKPVWDRVKEACKAEVTPGGSGIVFWVIDEDKAKTPGVTEYPVIYMLDEWGKRHQYFGPPDFERLRNWVTAPVLHRSRLLDRPL